MQTKTQKLNKYYLRTYGISWDQRQGMLKQQDNCCAICGKNEKEFKRRLAVDHDHKTGKVRALLCFRCNKFLVGRHTLETSRKVYHYFLEYGG